MQIGLVASGEIIIHLTQENPIAAIPELSMSPNTDG